MPSAEPPGGNGEMICSGFCEAWPNAALGSASLQFSNPSGSTLRVVDNGAAATKINAASVTKTATSLANGSPQLPLFTDGASLYTGSISSAGTQFVGLAGRITVNAAVLSDPSKLSVYNTSPATQAGEGATAISGYTTSAVQYTLNGADPTKIDAVAFTISPTTGTVKAQLVSAGSWYACTNSVGSVSCATTSPQATVATANQLTVVAAQ